MPSFRLIQDNNATRKTRNTSAKMTSIRENRKSLKVLSDAKKGSTLWIPTAFASKYKTKNVRIIVSTITLNIVKVSNLEISLSFIFSHFISRPVLQSFERGFLYRLDYHMNKFYLKKPIIFETIRECAGISSPAHMIHKPMSYLDLIPPNRCRKVYTQLFE